MTDTEPHTPAADDAGNPAHSALTHPHLHHADATDDLTGNTEGGGPEPAGLPREGGPSSGTASTQPDLMDDAADLTDGARQADDHTPGDGTIGSGPPLGEVDAVRTVARGREAAAARADTSDSAPTPTETHPG